MNVLNNNKFSIAGIGISIGSISNSRELIEYLVNDKKVKNEKNNQELLSIREALKDVKSGSKLIVYCDKEVNAEYFNEYLVKKIIENEEELTSIESAMQSLNNDDAEYAVIIAHTNSSLCGCAAIILGKENESMTTLRKVKDFEENDQLCNFNLFNSENSFSYLSNIIIAHLEVLCGLDLKGKRAEDYIRYLWISNDKRIRNLLIENNSEKLKLQVEEPVEYKSPKLKSTKFIVPVSFNSKDELLSALNQLKDKLELSSLKSLSREYLCLCKQNNIKLKNTISFVVKDKSEFLREIKDVIESSDKFINEDFSWKSKGGSFYISNSKDLKKDIVFMHQPSGMLKSGIFHSIYSLFPQVVDYVKHYFVNDEVSTQVYETVLNKISILILKSLGVNPNKMVGASMGEVSIFLDKDILEIENNSSENLSNQLSKIINIISKVFSKQFELAESYFGHKVMSLEKWYLKCDSKKVQKEVDKEKEVFMFIIGSPNDVIISGEKDACKRVIEKLKCIYTKINDPSFVHTPILEPAMDEVVKSIYEIKAHIKAKDIPYDIYSTYLKRPLNDHCKVFAENIGNILSKPVDFSSLISKVYDDGGRIFFDLGSGNITGNWAEECLKDKKDVQVNFLFSKGNFADNFVNIFAKLISYHADIDIDKFIACFDLIDETEFNIKDNNNVESSSEYKIENRLNSEEKGNKDLNIEHGIKNKLDSEYEILLNEYLQRQALNNKIAFKKYLDSETELLSRVLKIQKNTKCEKKCLWDRKEIEHMTDISMSDILGDKYKEVDKFAIRARMPLPPFLFVSRILSIDAEFGVLRPSSIEMEYDIDEDFIFKINENTVSSVIISESSHIGIFLAAYMGVDVISDEQLKFRAVDASTTVKNVGDFYVGDTIRVIYRIDRFVKKGSTILLFTSYDIYNNNKLLISTKAIGGFFRQKDLESTTGIISDNGSKKNIEGKEMLHFSNEVNTSYDAEKTREFFKGNPYKCFSENVKINLKNPIKRSEKAIVVDEIVNIDYKGGKYNSGYICSKKYLDPSYWVFKCHFKNDPVLPGTVMVEGLSQTFEFLISQAGLLGKYKNVKVEKVLNSTEEAHFRGQARPIKSELKFEINIKSTKETEDGIYIESEQAVIWNDVQIIQIENCCHKISGER